MHFSWKKTKCLCRFLDVRTKSQSRISKKDLHKAEAKRLFQNNSKIGIDKQKSCARGTLLALANDRSPNGVQRGTLLALAKIILLVDICAVIFRNLSIPKSCLWRLLDGKMELKTWETYLSIKKNVCCGIPYGHRSAPVHVYTFRIRRTVPNRFWGGIFVPCSSLAYRLVFDQFWLTKLNRENVCFVQKTLE